MTVVIAGVALAFSVATFFTSFLTNRQRDQRDLFLRIHERLGSVDQQRGRQLIHELLKEQGKRVEDLDADQREAINNALGTLNLSCFYYVRRYIRRADLLQLWGLAILRVFDAAAPYLTYRASQSGGVRIWQDLDVFAADARDHLQWAEQPVSIANDVQPADD
jgi:hypothetical protein